jgi:hypothetical protein
MVMGHTKWVSGGKQGHLRKKFLEKRIIYIGTLYSYSSKKRFSDLSGNVF